MDKLIRLIEVTLKVQRHASFTFTWFGKTWIISLTPVDKEES